MVSIHSISDDGNKEAVKEAVNEFVLRIMADCETMGYSEERRAQEDWDADAADILENRQIIMWGKGYPPLSGVYTFLQKVSVSLFSIRRNFHRIQRQQLHYIGQICKLDCDFGNTSKEK